MAAQFSSVLTVPPICRLHRSALSWLLQVIEKMLKMTDPRTDPCSISLINRRLLKLPVACSTSDLCVFQLCIVHVLLPHLSVLPRKSSLHHSCHVLSHYSCLILATSLHCNCSHLHLFLLLFPYTALVFVQAKNLGLPLTLLSQEECGNLTHTPSPGHAFLHTATTSSFLQVLCATIWTSLSCSQCSSPGEVTSLLSIVRLRAVGSQGERVMGKSFI